MQSSSRVIIGFLPYHAVRYDTAQLTAWIIIPTIGSNASKKERLPRTVVPLDVITMKFPDLQFVYDEKLFKFHGQVQPRWHLISDLAQAKNLGYEGATDDGRPNWNDMRKDVAISCGIACYWPPGFQEAVQALAFAYTPWWLEELEEDVRADLAYCLAYQLARTQEARLFPMILEAYAAGGWPCGWTGEYPDGQLCVYWQDPPVSLPEPSSAHERRVAYQKRRCREYSSSNEE